MKLFDRLIDDAALVGPAAPKAAEAVEHHRRWQARFAAVLRSMMVEDQRLLELDRVAAPGTPVTVVNTTGAGGLTALAGRSVSNLRLVAVDGALRDPGDLAGNVARIAAAARELDPAVAVNVVLPGVPGWEQVVGDIEAEGLYAVIGHGTDAVALATSISVLVEADLTFSVDAVPTAAALLKLLSMIDALVHGTGPDAVGAEVGDHVDLPATISGWGADRAGRVRRRLRSVRTDDPAGILQVLEGWKLITAGTDEPGSGG